MLRFIELFRNFLLIWKFWGVVRTSDKIINDAKSNFSQNHILDMTKEEIEGVREMEIVGRILQMKRKELKRDLKHLRDKFSV